MNKEAMKIITIDNIMGLCVDDLRKVAAVFTPVRETVDYKGAEYEVRVNNLSNADQAEILSINVTNPYLFYSTYLTTLNTIQSVVEEKIRELSEHFGSPEEVEVEVMGLKLIISTPTDDIQDAQVTGVYVADLKKVLENIHPADFSNIKNAALQKAKQYFEKSNETV